MLKNNLFFFKIVALGTLNHEHLKCYVLVSLSSAHNKILSTTKGMDFKVEFNK